MMNDIRIRTGAAFILSLAAFLNTTGAVAVMLWWLLFTRRFKSFNRSSIPIGSIVMVSAITLILQALYGTGISYGIRMSAILLVAIWLWSEQQPGEFLHLGVWLFGRRWGFELGVAADLAMLAFDDLLRDLSRIRIAWRIKSIQLTAGNLSKAAIVLVRRTIERATDTSELLAVRGYQRGGSFCPAFHTESGDFLGGIAAVAVGLFAIIPVSGFFILP
ncbi:MAG: hypothetical protein A4E35_01143 [Methanoregula sp. PtaU1.Bin051]|nr:MAG: hypothetical protein A4E35_01143 [Methanoregula sp. PtaU1.Bin051]